ncbi:hypothetical protein [Furfurilactobacillus milii]|uniref:Lipoprotein n=1 Tax=Furfurilactobacillus milii TaxID=2888272 RepID=A0ABT6D7X6_9LACO|nr:hypothetical protein [Furfurilactobacillus milii]QLE65824.1 hypothetical protein LROSL2_0471 [Furfurilactobacillus rossiae]MCF6160267.1 hypothetical protein [Furfurilactobacillus milii]MCF6162210.1 hypothetical protein [Furfurilactobacillus milii]MCF6420447.1 hypothetical protein [Furfurilactobacillus milii]MDF9913229.1 hypothetical protein [Furfurilactobacillus milii]
MTMKGFKIASVGLLTVVVLAGCSASATAKTNASSGSVHTTSQKVVKGNASQSRQKTSATNDTTEVNSSVKTVADSSVENVQPSTQTVNTASSSTVSSQPSTGTTTASSSAPTIQSSSVSESTKSSTPVTQSVATKTASATTDQSSVAQQSSANGNSQATQQASVTASSKEPQQSSTAQTAAAILLASGQDRNVADMSQLSIVNADPKWGNITPGDDGQVHVLNTNNGVSNVGYTITGDTVKMYTMPSAVSGADWVNQSTGSFSLQQAVNQSQTNPAAPSIAQKFAK